LTNPFTTMSLVPTQRTRLLLVFAEN